MMKENNTPKVDLYYVSDPICSHCWGLEPQLNKFLSQYGHYVNFHTVMGGILKSWEEFSGDKWNDVYEAKDTTAHWREFASKSGMPIDGSLMQDNPVSSSFPSSQVVKLLQEKDYAKANLFLRKVREALFVHNRNIAKSEVLIELVNKLGEDGETIVNRALTPEYEAKVMEDQKLMRKLGAKVTPAVIFVNQDNRKIPKVGMYTANDYKNALKRSMNIDHLEAHQPQPLNKWLEKQDIIFAKEIEIMYDLSPETVASFIERTLDQNDYKLKTFQDTFFIERV